MSIRGSAATAAEQAKGPAVQNTSRRRAGVDPHVVSVPDAAKLLGISKDLAYDLARRGELPGAFQLGRRWLVSLIKLRVAVHGAEGSTSELVG